MKTEQALVGSMLAFLLIFCLTGCASKIEGLVHHGSFTEASVREGRMAVGGVVSMAGKLAVEEENSYAALLHDSLRKKRKDVPIEPVDAFIDRVGIGLYAEALDEYRKRLSLQPLLLKELKGKMEGIRYLVFAGIDRDDVTRIESVTYRTKDGKITVFEAEAATEERVKTTTRTVTASLHIFDLELGIPVWGGKITTFDQENNTYEGKAEGRRDAGKELAGAIAGGVVKGVFDGLGLPIFQWADAYPEIPLSQVLGKVFAGFVENLPGKGR